MSSFKKRGPTQHTSLISKAIVQIDSIYGVGIHKGVNRRDKCNFKVLGDTEKRPGCHTWSEGGGKGNGWFPQKRQAAFVTARAKEPWRVRRAVPTNEQANCERGTGSCPRRGLKPCPYRYPQLTG